MGLFDKLFGSSPPKKQRTLYDDFKATAVPLVVHGYRRVAAERGCAPGPGVSDEEIFVVYEMVLSTFQRVAHERGEHLPAAILNNIALIFLQKYQMFGQTNRQFFIEHIAYEVHKYKKGGLREEYRKEFNLW
jgi:hypothetical protein